jgi:translocation and assembly module TamA
MADVPTGRRAARHLWGATALALAAGLLAMPAGPAGALDDVALRVPGAEAGLLAQIRASSLVIEAQTEGRTGPVDLMAAARAEYGRLIGLLYEQGYFAPTIRVRVDGREAAEVSTLRPPARIGRIDIDIDLGPQFTFGRAEIAPLAPGTTLPDGFARGETARSTVIRAAAGAALDGWRAQGHALAEPAGQEIVASHPDRRLDVALRIAPGPRLAFGALRPTGHERTRDARIAAIAGLTPGAVYEPAALAEAEARLRRTGTFSAVSLRPAEAANPDGTIDIDARLEEAPLRRLGAGAEIDTESGLGLSGFWLHRNLLGGAERLRFEASLTGIGSRTRGLGYALDLRYTRPAVGRPDTDLELGLRAARLDERDFGADQALAEARLIRRLSPRLTGTVALGLRYERARFGPTRVLRGSFGVAFAEGGLTWDSRDAPLDATRGSYAALTLTPYLGFLQADSGLHLRLDARQYADFGTGGRVVLAGRAQLGAVLGPDLDRTPRDFLFYSGGGGTVRGLPFQSLGATSGAVRSGGQGFAALSGEARVRVNTSFSVAAFADAGYVSERPFAGRADWQAGAGVGLRYLTPIGPLRMDLAAPVRRNADAAAAAPFQIYVGIGQAF